MFGNQTQGERWLLLGALTAALPGCHSSFVQRAESAYDDGRFLEAVEALVRHENELAALPTHKQARYGMLRGLSLLEVGDYAGAEQWLRFTLHIESAEPTLGDEDRARLDAAWTEVKRR